MSPLNRKLGRDLWRIKGQAVAIALVISVGVLMQVMMTGLVASLDETRRAYYERYRLAEVFAPVARAPDRVLKQLRQIPGVSAAEARVVGGALIDLQGTDVPVRGQVVSLPNYSDPRLNDIYLTDGRRIEADREGEVLVLNSFARVHGLTPGDTLTATINGFRREFLIVGFAQSPEFLYTTAPGEMVPDDSRFAVVWMSRRTLEAALDMEGAFNEAILSLSRGTDPAAVIDAVDRVLDRYGGLGAYGLEDLESNRFVSEEINGLRATSGSVPPVFLAVAAFLLYIVISRMVQAEREEIGLMKAFGYTNAEVGGHYFKLILVIAAGGALFGCLMGIVAGRVMADFYLLYFKFPFLVFQLDPSSFISGFIVSILSASAGGVLVLRGVFALTPASAMRPPAPQDYSRTGRLGASLNRFLDQPSRMVLRRLTRQPGRMAGAVAGVAAGVALSSAMMSILASFDEMIDLSFGVIDRSDALVMFIHPLEARSAFELKSVPGVIEVEPVRIVPAILHNGLATYRGAINGLVVDARLNRAIDAHQNAIPLNKAGIVLSTGLAKTLGITAGETLGVNVREGRQPDVNIPVVAVSESLLGSPAYMELEALNRVLNEPLRVSGAYLRIDGSRGQEIYRKLKEMPMVAGVSLKGDSRATLQKIMDQGAGAQRFVMSAFAVIITFGVIYNAARVAQAERARDLAALRVLGFTRAEVAFVLLGELAVVTLLALPIGGLAGYGLNIVIAGGFSTDLYQIPSSFKASSYGTAISIVIIASVVSGWLVKRDIDRSDLVESLKTRE